MCRAFNCCFSVIRPPLNSDVRLLIDKKSDNSIAAICYIISDISCCCGKTAVTGRSCDALIGKDLNAETGNGKNRCYSPTAKNTESCNC